MLRRGTSVGAHLPAPQLLDGQSHEEVTIRSAILAYVVSEGHHEETIFSLAQEFSPDLGSDAVERAVLGLVREELLNIDGGRVVPGREWLADLMIL